MAQIKKDGKKWSYRVWWYDDNGKKKSAYKSGFRTKPDAAEAANKLETLKNHGANLNKSSMSFADYYDQWMNDVKLSADYSVGTKNRYKHTLALIKNEFADTPLREINQRTYRRFLNKYAAHHSKASVEKVNNYIREMTRSAISEQIIFVDFTEKAKNNGKEAHNEAEKYLQQDQFTLLKNEATKRSSFNNISAAEIVFGILTGARYEEVTAVSWDRIDFKAKTVTLDRAYDYQKNSGFKKMKTKSSHRTIVINQDLINMLTKLKTQQKTQYIKTGYRDENQLVFRSRYRTVPTNTSVNKVLKNIQTVVGIPENQQITFHGLRHTHASYLISNGVQISYVSKRLGHKNVGITIRVYSHLLDAAAKLEEEKSIILLNSL